MMTQSLIVDYFFFGGIDVLNVASPETTLVSHILLMSTKTM
jgi:hypothetical protein